MKATMLALHRLRATLIIAACLSQPLAAQFGDLPPGHVSFQRLDGVRTEIVVYFLVDSASVVKQVPAGFQLNTMQRIATWDTLAAREIASQPHLRTAVFTVLGFAAIDSFQVDNGPPGPVVMAFWWLPVEPVDSLASRGRGSPSIELGAWSAPSVSIERRDGEWRLDLTLADGKIHGSCRPTGDGQPAGYPLPAYNTVWSPGDRPLAHRIYTFYGHVIQGCAAMWTAEGSGVLVTALANYRADSSWMQTILEDGWRARAGVYSR